MEEQQKETALWWEHGSCRPRGGRWREWSRADGGGEGGEGQTLSTQALKRVDAEMGQPEEEEEKEKEDEEEDDLWQRH